MKTHPSIFSILRPWLILTILVVIGTTAGWLVLRHVEESRRAAAQASRAEGEALAATLRQIREDAETAQKLQGEMAQSEVARYLEPADIPQAVNNLKKLAVTARLQDFSYELTPWQPYDLNGEGKGYAGLAVTTLTVRGLATHDERAYLFAEHLRRSLPGSARITAMTIERLPSPTPVAHVRMTLQLEWKAIK